MNDIGIYQIINKINGKFYIGATISFTRRFKEHINHLKTGKHHSIYLQRAWDKYGENAFEFKIILICSKQMIKFYEQKLLDYFKPCNRKGQKCSKESIMRMSIAQKKRWKLFKENNFASA